MSNIEWLNSLEDEYTSNIESYLEVLAIDFKKMTKICVSGYSERLITINALDEILNSRKFYTGVFKLSDKIEEMISYKGRNIDKDSLEFHLGCIKKVSEEVNKPIGKSEALVLAAFNFFREQKAGIVIFDDCYFFLKEDFNFDYKLKATYAQNEDVYSYASYDLRDLFMYGTELCGFRYKYIDFEPLNYGSFCAYAYVLALSFIDDYYPEIKLKKAKKIINDLNPNYVFERINRNPRVILNHIQDIVEYNDAVENVKSASKREVITISNKEMFDSTYTIKDVVEIKDIMFGVSNDDIVLILGYMDFVKEVKNYFLNNSK